jgi:M6 family metalloprotease-like protein
MKWGIGFLGALLAVLSLGTPVSAQDIESAARLRGLSLPDAYYQRVQADPTAYQLPNGLFRTESGGQRVASRGEGIAKLAIILALFSDSEEPHISRDDIQASLFDGPTPYGTITEAYHEMSGGALTVTGEVFPWVRTSNTMDSIVGTGNGLGGDADLGSYLVEALTLTDPNVDFGEYDSDGPDGIPNSGDDDGIVDAVTFEFLEIAGSCGGPSIWPHRWSINGATGQGGPYVTDDPGANGSPIEINGYITQSVADCTGESVQSANVISHEYGHVLGLPDYYHPTGDGALGRRWVLGCWSLMAAGSWGCGPVADRAEPFGPTHMTARSKSVLGWIDWVDPGEVWNQEIFLDPILTSREALRIPLGAGDTEFLIAEYRVQEGFDAEIPAEGVLLIKQDTEASFRPDPTTIDPYNLTMLEQDGNRGLTRNSLEGGNRGEAGDAWGVNGVSRKLHAATAPQLLLSDGRTTSVTIHEISVENGRARIVLSTGETPLIVTPEAPLEVEAVKSFLRFIRIAGGRQPYTVTGNAPSTMTLSANGDEVFVGGFVTEAGPHDLTIRVQDAGGLISQDISVQLNTTPWNPVFEQIMQPFLLTDVDQLSPGEKHYIDQVGNDNGRYDVGDLRKWIRQNGTGGS